ncbi:MAG: hypothetical protein OFPII_31870 [Osedax symbiont Rs1]|nr:MAG: hypothetical protein OFPII_31870 [Osedax symbiont Rs1]
MNNYVRFGLSAVLLLLAGCQLIKVEQANFTPKTPLRYDSNAEHIFNPQGKETFVLKSKPLELQKNGFLRFCQTSRVAECKNKLPYLRFVGMKGYFDQDSPVETDHKTYEFYPVVLENGNRYFLLSLKSEGGKYGKSSPIKSLYLADSYEKKPLFENSSILIVGKYQSFKRQFLLLSNGNVIEQQHLKYIRNISSKYKQPAKIRNLLLGAKIEYNEIYDSYLISPKTRASKSDFKLIIGLNDTRMWLRLNITHTAATPSHFNAYSIVADQLQWRSPILHFATKKYADSYTEFFEISANTLDIAHVKAMSKSSRAVFRFHGGNKVVYQLMKAPQKKSLADIIALYQLLAPPLS